MAAELAGMHAQTLRTYDRLGLVSPQRTSGGGRRYSEHDVDLLREVQRLSQDEGVNLAGIKRIIELTNQVEALQSRLQEMAEEIERAAGQPAPRHRGGAEEHRRWWSGSRAGRAQTLVRLRPALRSSDADRELRDRRLARVRAAIAAAAQRVGGRGHRLEAHQSSLGGGAKICAAG